MKAKDRLATIFSFRFLAWIYKGLQRRAAYRFELVKIRRAAREADRMHKLTGRRYWVMKLGGKYRVYSNREIKQLKRQKIFRKDLDILKIDDACVYKTKQQ